MSDPSAPGPSSGARTAFRVGGGLGLVVGLSLAIYGGVGVAHTFSSFEGPPASRFACLVVGMFMTVFSLGALNVGFLGAQARYAEREVGPSVRRMMGTSTGAAASDETRTGPFCRSCGQRATSTARFCDACGASLA